MNPKRIVESQTFPITPFLEFQGGLDTLRNNFSESDWESEYNSGRYLDTSADDCKSSDSESDYETQIIYRVLQKACPIISIFSNATYSFLNLTFKEMPGHLRNGLVSPTFFDLQNLLFSF